MSTLFSCGYLTAVQAKVDAIFADPILNNDAVVDTITAKAVLEQQQGMIRMPSITGTKNKELRVEWLTMCSPETEDCGDDCNIDGEDATPECKDYELECLQDASFKVAEKHYRDRTIEKIDAVAFNMARKMGAIDVWLSRYIITGLLTNAGVNTFTGGVGTVSGTTTYVPAQYWDPNIFGYFDQVIRMNKFRQTYGLTGSNLYQVLWSAPLDAANDNGKGAYKKVGTLKMYQDPENIETYATGQTFLIHRGSVAFLNKAWYPLNAANAENKAGEYWLWSEPSRNLPGVTYDIIMQQTCSNNEWYEAYKIQLHGLFVANPFPCSETNTGILVFECGTGD